MAVLRALPTSRDAHPFQAREERQLKNRKHYVKKTNPRVTFCAVSPVPLAIPRLETDVAFYKY